MEPEKPPPRHAEGCLTVAVRLPVRMVVLVLVVPVRMVWDVLAVGGRFLRDTVLRPAGRALLWVAWAVLVWPWVTLWRHALVPLGRGLARLGRVLVVVPGRWLYRRALTPLGHGIAWLYARVLTPLGHALTWLLTGIGHALAAAGAGARAVGAWLARYLAVLPAVWLYRHVLTPLGHGIGRLAGALLWLGRALLTGIGTGLGRLVRVLLVLPALALWRWVLTPVGRVLAVVGREIGAALGHAWRVAGHLSLAVGRFLGTLFRWIFVEPVRWVYRTVLTPVGHVVRDLVLRPAAEAARSAGRAARQALATARETVRQARAETRRLLFGTDPEPQPVSRREPKAAGTRTLGSSTTALTKD
ncbi:hypothetical protein [Streptomyces sp. NPDC007264]|uniref:hypothetical protein n=1 Tax=Streptomyces sp. NPDC007264 TaxID=3364777 RepID=UPI0036DCAAF8